MVVDEVSEILSFDQTNWLAPYIAFNTEKCQEAKNAFEKDFFKLMNNSVYSKTMENVRKYQDVKLMKMNNERDEKAFLNNTRRMKKISKNQQSFLARKAMYIYKSTVLFLPILGYFWLFLPICESVANLHESTVLFAPNIHAYFCLFFVIWPVLYSLIF